jgi:hypothetical protein
MKKTIAIAALLAAANVHAATPATESAACTASGDLKFVCGIKGPEDIVSVPGTPWLIAGSMVPGGGLQLINAQTKATRVLYPGEATTPKTDARYKSCPSAPDPKAFIAHGLHVRAAAEGTATLYVVNHGGRESIEVFDVKTTGPTPTLTWKGCVEMPTGIGANSVAAFGDGTLLATVFTMPDKTLEDAFTGKISGAVYQWRPGDARFTVLPGTELSGNNGIEVSKDEREFYVATTGTKQLVVFSRTQPAKVVKEVKLPGMFPDNVHWSSDGRLILGGTADTDSGCPKTSTPAEQMKMMMTCPHGFVGVAVDPANKMKVDQLTKVKANPAFSNVSAGILVGKEMWFGSWSADRVAYKEVK